MQDLKAKRFQPIYLLHGEESYFIDMVCDFIEANVLTEAEKAFNQTVLYARDIEINAVLDHARRFPMMATHQVIILKEAQSYKKLDEFIPYFEKPVPSTILVICIKGKKVDGRSRLFTLSKKYVSFESRKLYEDAELPAWIKQHLNENGLSISDTNAMLIADHLGSDLGKIANEIEKLVINKGSESDVSEATIEKYIGVSKEFNVFEMLTAIANRNGKRIFYINHHLSNNKDFSIIPLLAQFNAFFIKGLVLKQGNIRDSKGMMSAGIGFRQTRDYEKLLANFNVTEMEKTIALIAEFDLKSKGVNMNSVDDAELMKEFLFRILLRPELSS